MMGQSRRPDLRAFGAFASALSRLLAAKETLRLSEERAGALDPRSNAAPETRARRDLIDGVLEALGWDLRPFSRAMVEEARLRRGDHTRYGDYLGIVLPSSRPLLLIEAKELDAAPPTAQREWTRQNSHWANSIPALVQAGLQYNVSGGGPPPLSQVWLDWLSDLRDYASRCAIQHGIPPRVAVLTSGNWWLLVLDTEALINGTPLDGEALLFFATLDEISNPDFFASVARRELTNAPDATIEPTELPQYCTVEENAWIGNALWTDQSNDALPRYSIPRLKVGPAVTVVLTDGTVLRIASSEGSVVPTDPALIRQHFQELHSIRGRLIESLEAATPSFPERRQLDALSPKLRQDRYFLAWNWPTRGDVWVITLGEAEHFVAPDETYFGCPHHDYASARDDGHGLREPRMNPSVDPPVYFSSGSPMHCASQIVHDARHSRCRIAPVDHALCCRSCRFCSECWTAAKLAKLPCNALRTSELQ